MAKVTLTGYIIVPEDEIKDVIEALKTHTELTIAEAGCLTFAVTQDKFNRQKFNVFEEFINQQAFDNHQMRVKQSSWGKITANVSRHYQVSID